MLYSIQAYLEDYFNRRNLAVSDTYAVQLAKLYFHERAVMTPEDFQRRMRRVRTIFFQNNDIDNRAEFEKQLLERLDSQFKKKLQNPDSSFPGGLEKEKREIQKSSRRSISSLLNLFKRAVEARGIDGFWKSRKKLKLKSRPEGIAQSLFGTFAYGVLDGKGIVIRELLSGIGYVDVGVVFTSVLHLVEMKVITGQFEGPSQLEQYMRTEGRREGHLLVIDSRPPERKIDLPEIIQLEIGVIKVTVVDINPSIPSSLI